MDDPAFEFRLVKLFAEDRAFADSATFVGLIESRLGRGWALRRILIASGGVAGAIIVIVQAVGSGLWARITGATRLIDAARQGLEHIPMPRALEPLADQPFGAEGLWLAIGLVVLAVALIAGRSIEDR